MLSRSFIDPAVKTISVLLPGKPFVGNRTHCRCMQVENFSRFYSRLWLLLWQVNDYRNSISLGSTRSSFVWSIVRPETWSGKTHCWCGIWSVTGRHVTFHGYVRIGWLLWLGQKGVNLMTSLKFVYFLHTTVFAILFSFLDIPFETESQLRDKGSSRTPDILLQCPIGVKVGSEWRVVCWIDSKVCHLMNIQFTPFNKNINSYFCVYDCFFLCKRLFLVTLVPTRHPCSPKRSRTSIVSVQEWFCIGLDTPPCPNWEMPMVTLSFKVGSYLSSTCGPRAKWFTGLHNHHNTANFTDPRWHRKCSSRQKLLSFLADIVLHPGH